MNFDDITSGVDGCISDDFCASFTSTRTGSEGLLQHQKDMKTELETENQLQLHLQGEAEQKEIPQSPNVSAIDSSSSFPANAVPTVVVEQEKLQDIGFDSVSKTNKEEISIKMVIPMKEGKDGSAQTQTNQIYDSDNGQEKKEIEMGGKVTIAQNSSDRKEEAILMNQSNTSGTESSSNSNSSMILNKKNDEITTASLTNGNDIINEKNSSSTINPVIETAISKNSVVKNDTSFLQKMQQKKSDDTKPLIRSQSVIVPPVIPLVVPSLVSAASASNIVEPDLTYAPIIDEPGEYLQLQTKSHGVKKKENKQGIKYESRIRYQYGETSADSSIAYLGNYQCPITAARTYDMAKVITKGLYVVREKAARSLNFEYDFLVMKGNKGRILYMRTKPLQPDVTPVKIYRVASSINWLHGRDNHIWKLKEKEENHNILYKYCDVIPWNNVEEALIELGEGVVNFTVEDSNNNTAATLTSGEPSSINSIDPNTSKKIKETTAEDLKNNNGNLPPVSDSSAKVPSFAKDASDTKNLLGTSFEDLQQLGYDFHEEEHVGVDSTGRNVQRKKLERLNNRKKKTILPTPDMMVATEDGTKIICGGGVEKLKSIDNRMTGYNNTVEQKNKRERKRKVGEAMLMTQNHHFRDGERADHLSAAYNPADYGDDHLSFDEILKTTNFNSSNKTSNKTDYNHKDTSDKGKKKRARKNPAADTTISSHTQQIDYPGKYNFGAACFSLPALDTSAYNLDINFTNTPFPGCSPYQSNLMLVTNALATVASGHNLNADGSGHDGMITHGDHHMMNMSLRDIVGVSSADSTQMKYFHGDGGAESYSETSNTKSEITRRGRKNEVEEQNDALTALYGDSISAYDYL